MSAFYITQISPLFKLTEIELADWMKSGLNTYYLRAETGERNDRFIGFRPYSILFAGHEYPGASLQDIYDSANSCPEYQAKLRDAIILVIETLRWGGPESPESQEAMRLGPPLTAIVRNLRLVPALEALSKRVCPANGWRLAPILYNHALNAAVAMASTRIGGHMLNRLVFEDGNRIPSTTIPAVLSALLRTVDPSDKAAISALATKLLPRMPTLSPGKKSDLFDMIITAVGEENARTVFSSDSLRSSYLPDELTLTASTDIAEETLRNVLKLPNKRNTP